MQPFIKTGLVSLIKKSIKKDVSIAQWEVSYEAFANVLFAESQKFEKLALHNALCYAKAELVFWQKQNSLKKK